MLNISASHIFSAICHIFNRCLISGTCPKLWKMSKIIPLIKDTKCAFSDPNNRPLTILPILRKLLEKIISTSRVILWQSLNFKSPTRIQGRLFYLHSTDTNEWQFKACLQKLLILVLLLLWWIMICHEEAPLLWFLVVTCLTEHKKYLIAHLTIIWVNSFVLLFIYFFSTFLVLIYFIFLLWMYYASQCFVSLFFYISFLLRLSAFFSVSP